MAANGEAGARRWCWAGGELHTVVWGDETAVFHEPTASTHLLDTDTSLVITALSRVSGAASTSELWRQAFGSQPQQGECEALCDTLEALARVGLVAPFAS